MAGQELRINNGKVGSLREVKQMTQFSDCAPSLFCKLQIFEEVADGIQVVAVNVAEFVVAQY